MNDILDKLKQFARSPGYFEIEWIENAVAEIERLRLLMGDDMAFTACPVCGSDTANSNEVRINKMLLLAEKDAARYRWLKTAQTWPDTINEAMMGGCNGLDEAIDAVMYNVEFSGAQRSGASAATKG